MNGNKTMKKVNQVYTIITIIDGIFHNYGYCISSVGETLEDASWNLEKKFVEHFKDSWKKWGGKYSPRLGFYNREGEFHTLDDVMEYYGGKEIILKNGNVWRSDMMHKKNKIDERK